MQCYKNFQEIKNKISIKKLNFQFFIPILNFYSKMFRFFKFYFTNFELKKIKK